jgi:RNA polymerase primary sigma factor
VTTAEGSDVSWYLDQIGREPLLTAAEEITLGNAVRAWLDHPDGSEHAPRSVKRIGKRAKDRMVRANLRLVVHVVQRIGRRTSLEFMDLVQAGNLGMIRAVELFDPARGYKFSTYAYWWIRQGVGNAIDGQSHTIRLPTTYPKVWGQMLAATRQLAAEGNHRPSRHELAHRMGVTEDRLAAILQMAMPCASLDAAAGDDEHSPLGSLLADGEGNWIDQLDDLVRRENLTAAITTLDPLQQRLVMGHYGLNGSPQSITALARIEGLRMREVEGLISDARDRLGVLLGAVQASPAAPLPPAPMACASVLHIPRIPWRRVRSCPGQLVLPLT